MEIEEEVVPETPPALRACCLQAESGEVREHYELGYLEVDTEDYSGSLPYHPHPRSGG